jgi:hypothetical protein
MPLSTIFQLHHGSQLYWQKDPSQHLGSKKQLNHSSTGLVLVGFMVLKATFNNISVTSWLSVLLVEETGVRYHVVVGFTTTCAISAYHH